MNHDYSIAPSDMAFHALTTSLYKDRLRAPVREILSNAIDIQRRTGNQTPIDIKLPTPLDSQFRIRDYGTGLSKDDMLRLYSGLFSSDKHLSRANEVGGFGVGAKSPFAYTDAFTVESFHQGVKTIYSAFMDGSRAPQLIELFQEPTDEADGLAVSYPVVKADEETLRSVVRQEVAVCGFPVNCMGLTDVVTLETSPKFEKLGNMWLGHDKTLVPTKDERGFLGYARMGNVLYPLRRQESYPKELSAALELLSEITQRDKGYSRYDYDDDTKKTKDWRTMVLDLPIGSVRPAMSREELVADDTLTIGGLTKACGEALKALYTYTLEKNDPAEYQTLLRQHDRVVENIKKTSSTGLFDEIEPLYNDLRTRLDALHEKDKIWKDSGVLMYPGLERELMHMRGRTKDGLFGRRPPESLLEGFMPLGRSGPMQAYGRPIKPWSEDSRVIVVSATPAAAPIADLLLNHSRNSRKLTGFSKGPIHSDPSLFLMLLGKALQGENNDKDRGSFIGYNHDETILLFASSDTHEQALLDLAKANGKDVTTINMDRKQVDKLVFKGHVEPATPDASSISARIVHQLQLVPTTPNPYMQAKTKETMSVPVQETAPQQKKEPIAAAYWDRGQNKMVAIELDELPKYYTFVPGEPRVFHRAMEPALRSFEDAMYEPNERLYLVPLSSKKDTDKTMVSPAWDALINNELDAKNAPQTYRDWLLAHCDLPNEHPLYNKKHALYIQALSHAEALYHTLQDNYRSRNAPSSSVLETLKDLPGLTEGDKTSDLVLKRYPLLANMQTRYPLDPSQGGPRSEWRPGRELGSYTGASINTRLPYEFKDALVQYIALVDNTHPTFPPELLASRPIQFSDELFLSNSSLNP